MANPIFFSDYSQAELVAATNDSQTTILLSVPTEPLPTLSTPGDYCYITIVDQASFQIDAVPPAQREIMKVTAWTTVSTGIQCTVERGITTTPQIWAVGSIMELRACTQALLDLKDSGGGGFVQAQYVTMATDSGLDYERVLTAGTGISITDGGAGSTVTVASTVDPMVQATYVVMSASGSLTSERVLTAGTNITITDGGANSTVTINASSSGGGGTSQSEEFLTSDTWTVPAGVSLIWVDMIGGGASGSSVAAAGGGSGGGAGELCEGLAVPCTPAASITVTIGAGGVAANAATFNAGGDTSVTSDGVTYYARGAPSRTGGGIGGGLGSTYQTQESNTYFGGSGGGAGGNVGANNGAPGGTNASYPTAAAFGATAGGLAGGGSGGNSPFGLGGAGGTGDAAGSAAPAGSYGAGGGGSGAKASGAYNSGAGLSGRVLIQWIG